MLKDFQNVPVRIGVLAWPDGEKILEHRRRTSARDRVALMHKDATPETRPTDAQQGVERGMSMAPARRDFTEWFDRTYVINLPQRRDRRQQILNQFSRAGVRMESGRVEIFPAHKPESKGGFPSIGAHGCFMSHREVLVTAVREGLQRVLILEDDLELAPAILSKPDLVHNSLDSTDWGLAYLGHNLDLAETKPPRFVATRESSVGAHFYALQGEAIAQVVDFLDTVLTREPGDPLGGPMHYDGALSMFRAANPGMQTVACTVPLGNQGSSRSDITPRPWDRYPVVREISHTLRRIRKMTRKQGP